MEQLESSTSGCTACIVETPPVFLNLGASVDLAIQIIEEASRSGAKLVVFPETWLPGYPVWLDCAPRAAIWDDPGAKAVFSLLFDNSISLGDEHCSRIQAAVDRCNIVVTIGVNERIRGTINNSILFLVPRRKIAVHRKLMPTYSERMIWGRGDGSTLTVVATSDLDDSGYPEYRLGGLICWEHWMPLARAAMHELEEDIHVALWPYVKEMNLVASRHYAFEGRCTVIAAGCRLTLDDVLGGCSSLGRTGRKAESNTGSETVSLALSFLKSMDVEADGVLLRGGSAVIAPDGGFVLEPVPSRGELLYATINLSMRKEELITLDTAGHYSRPDVFTLTVDTASKEGVQFVNDDATSVDLER